MEMNSEKLSSLIALGESETLEFKESFGDEAIETIGSFSNSRGGILIIGVKDSGEICGFNCGKNNLEEFANRIQNVTDPRLQPSLSTFQNKNKNIIVIHVLSRTGAPLLKIYTNLLIEEKLQNASQAVLLTIHVLELHQ